MSYLACLLVQFPKVYLTILTQIVSQRIILGEIVTFAFQRVELWEEYRNIIER